MKIVVELPSGPFWIADTSLPIWLSPTSIEAPLCWLVGPLAPLLGVKIQKVGIVPCSASAKNCASSCMLLCWDPSRHSAKLGQIDHLYGPRWLLFAGFTATNM